ncbi:putative MFS family arabinose efflux permease [Cryobacterium sp. MP_M3]|nr:putative MFS family arabinose efflux permease [Cryobacterium sp. MP_M3]
MRVLSHASATSTLASGANIAAFNLGNALGAWLGGLTITVGLGYTSPIWAGAGVTVLGLAVMLAAARGARRQASVARPAAPDTGGNPDAGPELDREPGREPARV